MVKFAQKIVELAPYELSSFDKITSTRLSILGLRGLNNFTISEILMLLATSFSNTNKAITSKGGCSCSLEKNQESTQAILSKIILKQLKNSSQGPLMPKIPSCVPGSNNQMAFGVMSVYSDCEVEVTSESVFLVSRSESKQYHGSLADHPGCSIIIDVNTGPKESLIQVLKGTLAHRRRIADQWVKARARSNFANLRSLDQYLKTIGGKISESHSSRICF